MSQPATTIDRLMASSPERVLDVIADAAEIWGAEWRRDGTGGRLVLPVRAGIRYGLLAGEVTTERDGSQARASFEIEHTEYHLDRSAMMILLLGGAGGLFVVVAPLLPSLLGLLPVAGLLMLLAWFLVASKIRNQHARDFFELVSDLLSEDTQSDPS